jgi:hypothetical protein
MFLVLTLISDTRIIMKNIILSGFFLVLLAGCQDFLVEESRSQMTEDYYNTEQGLYQGVAAVYSNNRLLYQQNMFRVNYYGDIVENASSMNNSYAESSDVAWGTLNELFRDIHKGIMIANRLKSSVTAPQTEPEKSILLRYEV